VFLQRSDFCRRFAFIILQIPFPATPFVSHPYKTWGCGVSSSARWSCASVSIQFAGPLLSYSYELLFPQLPSFHNHPHCPGVSPSGALPAGLATSVSPRLQYLSPLAATDLKEPSCKSFACHTSEKQGGRWWLTSPPLCGLPRARTATGTRIPRLIPGLEVLVELPAPIMQPSPACAPCGLWNHGASGKNSTLLAGGSYAIAQIASQYGHGDRHLQN
jgi:hypothetical protein